MKRHATLLASGAIFAMSAGTAAADCAEELARLDTAGDTAVGAEAEPGTQGGKAPEAGQAAPEAGGQAAQGATAGIAGEAGAQSGAAVESSEEAEAEAKVDEGARTAAIDRARAALAAGDEQGCMEALEEAGR